jgi:hypothetical protein
MGGANDAALASKSPLEGRPIRRRCENDAIALSFRDVRFHAFMNGTMIASRATRLMRIK